MAMFDWRGRNNRGEAVQGQLEAMSEGGVADQLVAIGVSPVHIALAKAVASEDTESWLARLNRKPVVDEDLMIFSRQMYTLNKAGVPILRAFAGLQASATKPAMVDLLKGHSCQSGPGARSVFCADAPPGFVWRFLHFDDPCGRDDGAPDRSVLAPERAHGV